MSETRRVVDGCDVQKQGVNDLRSIFIPTERTVFTNVLEFNFESFPQVIGKARIFFMSNCVTLVVN